MRCLYQIDREISKFKPGKIPGRNGISSQLVLKGNYLVLEKNPRPSTLAKSPPETRSFFSKNYLPTKGPVMIKFLDQKSLVLFLSEVLVG
jgi:hypothetical protein